MLERGREARDEEDRVGMMSVEKKIKEAERTEERNTAAGRTKIKKREKERQRWETGI